MLVKSFILSRISLFHIDKCKRIYVSHVNCLLVLDAWLRRYTQYYHIFNTVNPAMNRETFLSLSGTILINIGKLAYYDCVGLWSHSSYMYSSLHTEHSEWYCCLLTCGIVVIFYALSWLAVYTVVCTSAHVLREWFRQ